MMLPGGYDRDQRLISFLMASPTKKESYDKMSLHGNRDGKSATIVVRVFNKRVFFVLDVVLALY